MVDRFGAMQVVGIYSKQKAVCISRVIFGSPASGWKMCLLSLPTRRQHHIPPPAATSPTSIDCYHHWMEAPKGTEAEAAACLGSGRIGGGGEKGSGREPRSSLT